MILLLSLRKKHTVVKELQTCILKPTHRPKIETAYASIPDSEPLDSPPGDDPRLDPGSRAPTGDPELPGEDPGRPEGAPGEPTGAEEPQAVDSEATGRSA
jgi:hypothetical protein